MRILVTFIGGVGHLTPLLPVARAARHAGHEVVFACSGGLVERVEAAGFHALATSAARPPASGPPAPPPRERAAPDPTDARAAEVEFAVNFADKGARRHATAVGEHLRAWRPDLVVRDEADLGTAVAAEVAGVPVATVLVLAAGMLVRPELVSPPLAALRRDHGLSADPGPMLTGRLVLSPFPPSFRDPRSPVPLPPATFSYRPGSPAQPGPRSTRRGVYATLGTVFGGESGDLLDRLVVGLAGVDADVLLTVGADLDPADLGPQPSHVRVERFVPQDDVLPTVDLVVSHGGSGSLAGALAHGLPSVLLPLGADQPHNAARAAALGLAEVLDAATATPDLVTATVARALDDRTTAARAQQVAAEIAALPGVEETIPLLEAYAGV